MGDLEEENFNFWWPLFLCFFIESGADEKGLRLFHSLMVNEPETTSPKVRAHSPQTKIQQRGAAIVEETWQVTSSGKVSPGYYDSFSRQYKPVPQLSVPGPPREYGWTRELPGFEAADRSAASAVHRVWAATQAAAAGHNSKTPVLDVFLFQIRTGLIKRGDPRIEEAIKIFGKIGERITEELHNAEKRVPKDYCDQGAGNSLFYDLNRFRTALAYCWVGALFWTMPDQLIADFLLSQRGVLLPTTRQAVNQAVKEMGLVKHDPPVVKSIGRGFQLTFIEGYPPKS